MTSSFTHSFNQSFIHLFIHSLIQLNSNYVYDVCNFVHLFWIWFVAQWTRFTRPCEHTHTQATDSMLGIPIPIQHLKVEQLTCLTLCECGHDHDSEFISHTQIHTVYINIIFIDFFCGRNTDEGTIDGWGHFVNGWFFSEIHWSMKQHIVSYRIVSYRTIASKTNAKSRILLNHSLSFVCLQ